MQQSAMSREIASVDDPLLMLTLSESTRRLQDGDLSAEDLAEAVILAANRHSDLNAYTTFDANQLLKSAIEADVALRRGDKIGPLHGVPVILKDNINTRALPTSGGTPGLKNNQPGIDAPVAARLFAGGALLAGKANLHELSSGGTSNNHTFGAVGNPYDMGRVPGGSSGGTAAAVAAYLVPGGLGTDTLGSIRVPAALCGVVGLRPTTSRYPAAGIVPLTRTLDTAGPIGRSIADVALMDAVITGEIEGAVTQSPASMRLGVPYASLMTTASEDVARVVNKALDQLQAAGVTLIPVDLSEIQQLTGKTSGALLGYEFRYVMAAYLKEYASNMTVAELTNRIASPAARKLLQGGLERPENAASYREVQKIHLPNLKRLHADLYHKHQIDALIFPTTPEIALPRAEDDSVIRDGKPAFSWFYFSNTALASAAGNPSLTLPAGLSIEGMPVGLSIDGLPGEDRKILCIGRTIEMLLAAVTPPASTLSSTSSLDRQ